MGVWNPCRKIDSCIQTRFRTSIVLSVIFLGFCYALALKMLLTCMDSYDTSWTDGAEKIHSCPVHRGIVTVEPSESLEDAVFEYSSVWMIASLLEYKAYVPQKTHLMLRSVFQNLSVPSLEIISHCDNTLGRFKTVFDREKLFPLSNIYKKVSHVLLERFIILPEVFLAQEVYLKSLFQFRKVYLDSVDDVLTQTREKVLTKMGSADSPLTYVGVSVCRRCDKRHFRAKEPFRLPAIRFYKRAMNWYRQRYSNAVFMVVSDDLQWAMDHLVLKTPRSFYAGQGREGYPGHDLALLSRCNHTIFDYGTFGLFGALMAGGHTVAYDVTNTSSPLASFPFYFPRWTWIT